MTISESRTMHAPQLSLLLAVVGICACFSGCEDSENPLSDPQASRSDDRLVGVWRYREKFDRDADVTYFHIGSAGDKLPSGVMRVVVVVHDANGAIRPPGELWAFSTTIGSNTYLNLTVGGEEPLKVLKEKGWKGIQGYVLWKYKAEADTLLLWRMDPSQKERAIRRGKVRGVIKEGLLVDMNTIIDTTENLARFVGTAGDSLFSAQPARLERVK